MTHRPADPVGSGALLGGRHRSRGVGGRGGRHLTLDMTRASACATILECIRNGVTTIFDHHASFCEIPGSLFAIKDVAKALGMRACLCYEVSERDGAEKCAQSIRENAEFARWARSEGDDMIRAMFGGHALQ